MSTETKEAAAWNATKKKKEEKSSKKELISEYTTDEKSTMVQKEQMRGKANRMIGDNIEDSTFFVLEFSSQRQMQARVQYHPELSEHNKHASHAEETLKHAYKRVRVH